MLKSLILHVGMEKTGSTSIQKALSEQRAALRAKGFLYPTGLDFGGPQIRLTAACLDFTPHSPVLAALNIRSLSAAAPSIASRSGA